MTDAARDQAGHWLPDEARLIALVRDRGSDAWAAGVAVGLADMIGRTRGRTYLANVSGASDELDALLNARGGPGLTSALTGAATLGSIARPVPDQKFAFLPAGDAALPYPSLCRMQAFRRFLDRMRSGGATLLLYVGEEDLVAPGAAGGRQAERPQLDGCVALGEVRGLASELGTPLLARVERPRPPVGAAPVDAEDAPDPGGGDAGSAATRPVGSLVRLVAPLLVVALAWTAWTLATADAGSPVDTGTADPPSERAAIAAAPGLEASAPDPGSGPDAGDAGGVAPPTFAAPAARYSVLVGSYIRLADALERRDELAEDGGLFYVAPTPVRGRIYHRVLAGVYEDRADATAAMADLVEDGRKEASKEWDVRPVRLAFDLGTFASRGEAERRAAELLASQVPAYVLRDTATVPRWRVYAGAYTSAEDAAPLGRLLDEAGRDVTLETRAGIAP